MKLVAEEDQVVKPKLVLAKVGMEGELVAGENQVVKQELVLAKVGMEGELVAGENQVVKQELVLARAGMEGEQHVRKGGVGPWPHFQVNSFPSQILPLPGGQNEERCWLLTDLQ